jgi:ferredoxin
MLTLVGQYTCIADDKCLALSPLLFVIVGRATMYWPDRTRRLSDDQRAMCSRQYKDLHFKGFITD